MWQQPIAVPGGDCQSPIDIVVRRSVFDSALKPLAADYDPETCRQIWNNGYSFLVEYDDSADKSSEWGCRPLTLNICLALFACPHGKIP